MGRPLGSKNRTVEEKKIAAKILFKSIELAELKAKKSQLVKERRAPQKKAK